MLNFKLPLLAVKDVEVSKKFYQELLDQTVNFDFGENIIFSGGFGIQEDFDRLTGIGKNKITFKSNNMELYFETDDFDGFVKRLEEYQGIIYVHKPMMHDWKQRVVRITDPDYHIIEIGESMEIVIKRYLKEGHSIEETAKVTQHPIEFVKKIYDGMSSEFAKETLKK